MLNLKVALLLLLVFASTVTATAVAFSIPALVAFHTPRSIAAIGNFLVEPSGDPIDGSDPPHLY